MKIQAWNMGAGAWRWDSDAIFSGCLFSEIFFMEMEQWCYEFWLSFFTNFFQMISVLLIFFSLFFFLKNRPLPLSITIAHRPLPVGCCLSAIAHLPFPISRCPLVVAHRPLPVSYCRCPSAIARRPLPVGRCPSAVARRPLPVGCCPSAVAHWLSPVGRCPLAIARSPLLVGRCPSPLTVAIYPSPLSFVKRNFLWRWDSEANFFLLSFVRIFSWRWDSETFFSFCLLSTWRRERGDGTVW